MAGVIKFFNTIVQFLPSILIARILSYVDKAAASKLTGAAALGLEGPLLALALFSVLTVKTLMENQYFDRIITLGAAVRGALSTSIYTKALRLSPAGRQANTVISLTLTFYTLYTHSVIFAVLIYS